MSIQNITRKLNFISQNTPEKFRKLDNWLNTYLDYIPLENKDTEKIFPNIKRGQILYSPRLNPKITVVPITSKPHPHQLAINYELANNLETIIRDKERSKFWRPFRRLYPELQARGFTAISPAIGSYDTVFTNCTAFINQAMKYLSEDDIKLKNTLKEILVSLKNFDDFYKSAPKLLQSSYLKVEDITTISKARIIYPKTKTHPLYQLKLSNSTLDCLDQEIISKFTKSN